MSIKINYLIPSNKDQGIIGRLVFLNSFKPSTISFPYLYISDNKILYYDNWPNLVPFLYDKKLGYFDDNMKYITSFQINSFSTINGTATLYFTEEKSINALQNIYEDRQLHYFENNTYTTWNRTITLLSDITLNNKTFLTANENYKIESISVSNNIYSLSVKISNLENIFPAQNLINKTLEYGLYRLNGQKDNQSVYFTGIKSKYFNSPDSTNFMGGLRKFSKIIGHSHDHKHTLNEHKHGMTHIHNMSNHTHGMRHNHGYNDWTSTVFNAVYGPLYIGVYGDYYQGTTVSLASTQNNIQQNTNSSINNTNSPNTNLTGDSSVTKTNEPNSNVTSNIISENLTKDDVYTTTTNNAFRASNKNYYDTNVCYVYMYGGIFIP